MKGSVSAIRERARSEDIADRAVVNYHLASASPNRLSGRRARSAPIVRGGRRPEQFEPVRLVFDLVGQARDRQQELIRGRLVSRDDGRWRARRSDRERDQHRGEHDRNGAGYERQSSLAAQHPVPGVAVFATVGRAQPVRPALLGAYVRPPDATAIARRASVQRTSEDTV